MQSKKTPHIAVILTNLGTPDAPTEKAVRVYLRQFLSDTRVVEIPPILWQIILNLLILTTRPKKVAHAYGSIWQEDSPLRQVAIDQSIALQSRIDSVANSDTDSVQVSVHPAMSYGNPGLPVVLDELQAQGVEHFVVLPMFPQYSATSTGAVYDAISKWSLKKRDLPNISIIKDYFSHPLYITALANKIKAFQEEHGKPDKLMMSFHGIPKPFEDKGDPYPTRCRHTAKQLANELGLADDEWICSFQSRFGLQEWVKPYTDIILKDWGQAGVEYVQIVSPSFSADCLETLEELAIENKNTFLEAGGKSYDYIPALNADSDHVDLIEALTMPMVEAWKQILAGRIET